MEPNSVVIRFRDYPLGAEPLAEGHDQSPLPEPTDVR
jgi:hypothetical protein